MEFLRVALRRATVAGFGLALTSSTLVAFSTVQLGTATPSAATPSPLCGSPVLTGATAVVTCSYTGGAQYFVVPSGIGSVVVDAYGAQGGASVAVTPNSGAISEPGGLGGHTEATLSVTGGETLQVNVGGEGGDGAASTPSASEASATGGSGGWNGGQCGTAVTAAVGSLTDRLDVEGCAAVGAFSNGTPYSTVAVAAGGSGGASDVRDGADTTADRLVVAGGGGGAGSCAQSDEPDFDVAAAEGGGGGGSTGGTGSSLQDGDGGTGGTQVAGGTGGGTTGTTATDDQGAASGDSTNWTTVPTFAAVGGPGGAGYFGGGSGSDTGSIYCDGFGAGGGGSSYPTSATILAQGVQSGNGLVTFTYTLETTSLTTRSTTTLSRTFGDETVTFFATLTSGSSGVADQTVSFAPIGGLPYCTAVTASNGVASCSASVLASVVFWDHRYQATFTGSAAFLPSTATGSINVVPTSR